jgi:hypothetical protein
MLPVTPMTRNSLAVSYKAPRRTALTPPKRFSKVATLWILTAFADLAVDVGIEPTHKRVKAVCVPTSPIDNNLVRSEGFEPSRARFLRPLAVPDLH